MRIRPFTKEELKRSESVAVHKLDSRTLRCEPPTGSHAKEIGKGSVEYEYEQIFDGTSTQTEVYDNTAKSMVDGLFAQQNSLLFVYGVSNSGKTFTIQGPQDKPGLLPLALRDIYAKASLSDCAGM